MDALASCAASTPLVLASIPSYNLAQMIWACAALESSPQVLWRSLSDEGGEQEFKLLLLDLVGDEAARRIKMRTKGSQNLLSISGLQSYNSDTLDDEEKELSQGRKEWRDMIEGADPPHSQEPLHAADVAVIAESYARMGQPHPELFSSIIDDIIHLSDPKDSASSFIPSQRASQGYYGTRELEKLASAFSTLSHPQEEIVIARLQLALSRQARRRREREGEIASMDLDLDEEGEGVEDLSLAGRRRRKREPWHSAAAAAASVLTSFAAAAAAAAHAV